MVGVLPQDHRADACGRAGGKGSKDILGSRVDSGVGGGLSHKGVQSGKVGLGALGCKKRCPIAALQPGGLFGQKHGVLLIIICETLVKPVYHTGARACNTRLNAV